MKFIQILFVWPVILGGAVLITLGLMTAVTSSQLDASIDSYETKMLGIGGILLILGLFGCLIFRKRCPACRAAVPEVAIKCNKCGGSLATRKRKRRLRSQDTS